nr:hypothetical protein [Tanacetum cinerariifolium]
MVAILEKSDAAGGFEQIIDLLSGSYIHHSLTVNPHVYISCIKQFWNTAVVKRSGDVTRLQALVDKKRIVITKEVVHEILQLNDAEGVISLPNDEIFTGLAQMGYEKSSTKLAFYKAFFSTQWKFFIHTILHSLSAKRTSWNEFSSVMASALICLSSGVETPLFKTMLAVRDVADEAEAQILAQDDDVQEHVTEEIANEVVPPTPTSPSPSSPIIPSLPLHQSPSPPQSQATKGLENANATQQLEIVKLKARVKKLERLNKVKSSKLERIELVVDQEKDAEIEGRQADKQAEIYDIDLDHSSRVLSMQEDDTKVQEAVEVVTTAKLITEVVTAAATQVVSASTPISTAKPKVLKIVATPTVSTRKRKGVVIRDPKEELHIDTPAETPIVKDKGKGILIEDPKPMKKKDQIEMDAEYAKKLQEELDKEQEEAYKQTDWNASLDHVQAKEPQYIKRYHGIKMKPQSESKARKNMIFYLKNTKGYKMEFFKGKTYDQIIPIFQARFDANLKFLFKSREEMEKKDEEIIKSINETSAQKKVAKRRKLSEEAQEADDLKKRLEIIQDEDDDDEGIELVVDQEKVVIAAATQVVAASTPIPAAKPKILKIAAAPTVSTRRRKGVVIRDPEEELHTDSPAETPTVEMDAEYAKKLQEELDKEHEEAYKQIDWNATLDYVQSKEPQYIKRYHGIKKKPQSESKARKNMISYLKNTEGYKMEFFKGKTYDQILPIFQARKLSEEAQEADDLKKRLEIVQDEDDDVFVEATLLTQKVHVVDYQIVVIDNKPKIVRDRFSSSKPTNFSDEYLLLTLKTMFGELDEQDAIWRNQKSVHGLALVKRWKLLTSCGVHVIILSIVQLFLLVERRYPLTRFTLEQLENVARLQVEEESEMSLELLRFTRQQLLEYQQG